MLMFVCFIMEELNEIEIEFNKIKFVEFIIFIYLYVLVVELSNYLFVGEDFYENF